MLSQAGDQARPLWADASSQSRRARRGGQGRQIVRIFMGTHVNRIDRKGRVSVPAQFRAAFGLEVGGAYAMPSLRKHEALDVHLPETIGRLAQSSDPFGDEDEDYPGAIFSAGRYLGLDGEGRIVLPDDLRAFAHIADKVCFLGRGSFFQMWEPEAGLAYQRQSFRRVVDNGPELRRRPNGGNGGGEG